MISTFSKVFSVYILLLPNLAFGIDWVLTPTNDGLFTIQGNSLHLVTARYIGWNSKWKWAGTRASLKSNQSNKLLFHGRTKNLDSEFSSSITTEKNKSLWSFQWQTQKNHPDAIGFGLEFKFNHAESGISHEPPEIIPNKHGWIWRFPDGKKISAIFDPPPENIYFERGKHNKLRVFIFKEIEVGIKKTSMTLSMPENSTIYNSIYGRHQPPELKNWIPNIINWKDSPVDLSFLNSTEKPAGKNGFLKTNGDSLEFENGKKIRFWGTNIQAKTIFNTSKDNVKLHAKRLSKLGFNIVRIHHHDSHWVRPNIFESDNNTRKLSNKRLRNIDWWIKCLKDEGIYIWLDLHVGRSFTSNDDIENIDEIIKNKKKSLGKGYVYFNSDLERRLQEFNESYLNHINPYTGLALKEEPAIATILITNENDITHHYGNLLLPDKNVPNHNKRYMQDAKEFAQKNGLSEKKTWRSWEHGPSKLFLNEIEHQFNLRMIKHLRKSGIKIPIVTTNYWGREPISSLPSLSDGDIIDVHTYGRTGELESNPVYRANFISWITPAQIANKPVSVTEWNVSPFPVIDRHIIPIYFAGISGFQGWDSLMQYGYSQIPLNSKGRPSNWHLFNDPGLLSTMPAAALLYRQHHVKEALHTFNLKIDAKSFFYNKIDPNTSATLRSITEKNKLITTLPKTNELPWIKPAPVKEKVSTITNYNKLFIKQDDKEVLSDTGELYRNWNDGIFTINTQKSIVAGGWIGGQSIEIGGVKMNIQTPHAIIAIQSIDNKPIKKSRNILISMSARSVLKKHNTLPFYSEPVLGLIKIAAPSGLRLMKLDSNGKSTLIKSRYEDNIYEIKLDKNLATYWLKLTDG